MVKLTVIVCTHNPRPDFLRRVLDALKGQTFPKDQWELFLMDNLSKERLSEHWDLTWHPNGRHIREEKIGKANAVLTAIREARGELLLTVDDDNVTRSDYLANAWGIANEFPFLGAWSGNIEGEYEGGVVPDFVKPYLHAMAIRPVDRDYWANYYADNRCMPFGAGLCVRKSVADTYAKEMEKRPESKKLGRTGKAMTSGEDIDLAMTAYDCGFGTGMFTRLHITHLIPKSRMTVDYICRLLEGIEHSGHILKSQRDPHYAPPAETNLQTWMKKFHLWRLPEPVRSFARAEYAGLNRARADIAAAKS